MAAEVGPADRIVSSPLRRAVETAAAFGTGVEVEIDERWAELDYGEFDGVPVAQLGEATWARWRSEPDFAPPGGESLVALTARVHDACEALRDDARERTVVVVSHVSPIKAALAWALGVGPEVAWRSHLDPASITRISIGPAGPVVAHVQRGRTPEVRRRGVFSARTAKGARPRASRPAPCRGTRSR